LTKLVILMIVAGNLGTAGPPVEEKDTVIDNAVMFNTLFWVNGSGSDTHDAWSAAIEYHRFIGGSIGLSVALEYLSTSAYFGYDSFQAFGWGILVGPRFHFSGQSLKGWYLATMIGYARMDGAAELVTNTKGNGVSLALEVGYSFASVIGVMLTLGLGCEYRIFFWDADWATNTAYFNPRLVLSLGVGW